MKSNQIISIVGILLAFIIAGCSGKREKLVVDNPGYKERPRSLEIKRVECNDTATILNMVVSGPPKNWVRISSNTILSTEEGKQYAFLLPLWDAFELQKGIWDFLKKIAFIYCIHIYIHV